MISFCIYTLAIIVFFWCVLVLPYITISFINHFFDENIKNLKANKKQLEEKVIQLNECIDNIKNERFLITEKPFTIPDTKNRHAD